MAAETVGRADYELGVDTAGVKKGLNEADELVKASGKQVEETYKSAGYRAGEALGTGIKVGVKLIGGAAALAFGVATKGVIELENATADFRAETGATAEEADRAGNAINRMSGKNIAGVKEIGQALANVHTMMGVTGDAAEALTQDILTFARATKQDAGRAVSALDDILDGFNLEAKDSGRIMDALVASHQKYGGSIEANQAALAQMAPQLKALNLGWEDGVALLNAFAASGLDAAAGQRALNTAVANLPPGTTLKDFVAELSKIEDPMKRATRASEIFGTMAGPRMANVIKPGMDSLDQYALSEDEITGASGRAAAALDSTFGAKVQLKLKEFSAALTGVGKEFGPVITGLGGLVSLAGSIGLDDLARKFGPKFVAAMKDAGSAGADALQGAIESTGIGAAGTVIGNNIASRIEDVFDAAKQTRLGAIGRAAGAKIGAAWGIAFAAGSKLADVVGGTIMKLPGAGVVRTAVLTSGMALGGAYGKAIALGIGAGLVGLAAIIADATHEPLRQSAHDLHDQLFADDGPLGAVGNALEGFGGWLNSLDWPIGPKNMPDWARIGAATDAGVKDAVITPLERADQDIHQHTAKMAATIAADAPGILDGLKTSFSQMPGLVADSFASAQHGAGRQVGELGRRLGNLAQFGVAQGILEERQKPKDAWDSFLEMLKNSQTPAQETAQIIGRLTSDRLAQGLRSGDPAVRAQAVATKQLYLDRLHELAGQTGPLSGKAAEMVSKGLASKDADIRKAAMEVKREALAPIKAAPAQAYIYGGQVSTQTAQGIRDKAYQALKAAGYLAYQIAKILKLESPAEEGPLSLAGGPEGWGANLPKSFAKGMTAHLSDVRRAATAIAGAAVPSSGDWVGRINPPDPTVLGSAAGLGSRFEADRALATTPAVGTHPITINGGITIAFTEAVDFGRQTPRSVANELAQEMRLVLARTVA